MYVRDTFAVLALKTTDNRDSRGCEDVCDNCKIINTTDFKECEDIKRLERATCGRKTTSTAECEELEIFHTCKCNRPNSNKTLEQTLHLPCPSITPSTDTINWVTLLIAQHVLSSQDRNIYQGHETVNPIDTVECEELKKLKKTRPTAKVICPVGVRY